MSNYVIKVFEKQENGELKPFAFDHDNTVYELEGEGFVCLGITQSDPSEGQVRVSSQSAVHDVSSGAVGSALMGDDTIRAALNAYAKHEMLKRLVDRLCTEDKEEDEESAAE